MGGALLLALGGVISHLRLNTFALALLVWAFVVSSYVFAVVLPLAAYRGLRGLSSTPPLMNRILYVGNIIGAAGMLVGTIILLWDSYAALERYSAV